MSNDGKRFGKDAAGSFLIEFKTQFQHSSEGGHRKKQGKGQSGYTVSTARFEARTLTLSKEANVSSMTFAGNFLNRMRKI